MDLNPQSDIWSMEKGPFELADYCLSTEGKPRTNVLLLLNAWLDSKEQLEERWDLATLNYWLLRLRPLWKKSKLDDGIESYGDSDGEDEGLSSHHTDPASADWRSKQTIVVICNRCGDDNGLQSPNSSVVLLLNPFLVGTQFAGTSAVIKLQEGSGSPDVVGVMSRQQEGVRIWTIE